MSSRPLLSVDISRCGYPDGFVLRSIRFNLKEGDVLLVTGRSGSGKTTLVKAITGTLEAAGGFLEGKILINGVDLKQFDPDELYSMIGYIPQEPWYAIIAHTVYAEICHSLALRGVNCLEVDFNPLGITRLVNRLTYTLSAGETQRILWLESMLKESKVIVLDEPLVYLDQEARKIVKHYVKITQHRGDSAIVIVDHDPYQWEFLQPSTMVLEDGTVKYHGEWREDVLPRVELTPKWKGIEKGVVVRYRKVWFRYPGGDYVIRDFNGLFRRGLLTCIKGPNGSGKTTILKLGAGLLKPTSGLVERYGSVIYIPENALLFFTMPTPREELLLSAGFNESKVLDVAERFNIRNILDRPLAKLSTGERRRLALASAYLAGYDVYLVDEPTGGLDYENAKLVLEALGSLLDEEKAVVIATHDESLARHADHYIEIS